MLTDIDFQCDVVLCTVKSKSIFIASSDSTILGSLQTNTKNKVFYDIKNKKILSSNNAILKLLFTQGKKMLAKLTNPRQALTSLTTRYSLQKTATAIKQSRMIKHPCPCCSDTLLCHMRMGGLYWRCSSCYQEMPI
jgi:hypothetical protein